MCFTSVKEITFSSAFVCLCLLAGLHNSTRPIFTKFSGKTIIVAGLWSHKGYWHQRAKKRHGKPPQGNLELLVAKVKVGRPPGEFGVNKSIGCDFPFSALTRLGDRKGIRPVKKTWCWFVGSSDLTGALLQLSPPLPSFFASINTG